jgi:hypothetical protein
MQAQSAPADLVRYGATAIRLAALVWLACLFTTGFAVLLAWHGLR